MQFNKQHISINASNNSKSLLPTSGRAILRKFKSNNLLFSSTILDNQNDAKISLLTHCQICLNFFQQPITLECGFTLCSSCVPLEPQFNCPSITCLRTHTHSKPNVLLKLILSHHQSNQSYIKDLLVCSICFSTFTEPVTTKCGHTFCKSCLIHIITLSSEAKICPICRHALDPIGQVSQVTSRWINHYYDSSIEYDQEHDAVFPLIQISRAIAFPTQHCLFHVHVHNSDNDYQKLLHKRNIICIFTKEDDDSVYDYGLMLYLEHAEYLLDYHHIAVQARGLFPLRIKQLTIDHDDNNCYLGDIMQLKKWGESPVVQTITLKQAFHSTPSYNIHRPCSIRLSRSSSKMRLKHNNTMIGPYTRKAWPIFMKHQILKQQQVVGIQHQNFYVNEQQVSFKEGDNSNNNVSLFYEKLHPSLVCYLSVDKAISKQYSLYLQQSMDLNTLIWWVANILPLEQEEKIQLLSISTLRKRLLYLIFWINK